MLPDAENEISHWRGLVAAAATIETGHITQFSPEGFAEAMMQKRRDESVALSAHAGLWYYIKLGELRLHHDGNWDYSERDESVDRRMEYAHATQLAALDALKAAVAPSVPLCEVQSCRRMILPSRTTGHPSLKYARLHVWHSQVQTLVLSAATTGQCSWPWM